MLATKVRMPAGGAGVNNCGLGRKHILSGVARSLEHLRTDHVDLLQIHAWDAGTPIEETLRTLDDLVRRGSVHYVGASNCAGWQLQKALSTSEFLHLAPFVTLQPQSAAGGLFFLTRARRPRRTAAGTGTRSSAARRSGSSSTAARRRASGSCRGRRSRAAG